MVDVILSKGGAKGMIDNVWRVPMDKNKNLQNLEKSFPKTQKLYRNFENMFQKS